MGHRRVPDITLFWGVLHPNPKQQHTCFWLCCEIKNVEMPLYVT